MDERQIQALRETMLKLSKVANTLIELNSENDVIGDMIAAHKLGTADIGNLLGMPREDWNRVKSIAQLVSDQMEIVENRDAVHQAATRQRELTQLVRG